MSNNLLLLWIGIGAVVIGISETLVQVDFVSAATTPRLLFLLGGAALGAAIGEMTRTKS